MYIFEVFIYVSFTVVMCFFVKQSQHRIGLSPNNIEQVSNKLDKYLWFFMLFFSVISAIRWRVGVDSVSYIEIFRNGIIRKDSQEFLWDWLVFFVKNNGLHFIVGTGIAAFLQIFFLTESLKKYRYLLYWLPVVIFGGRYYLDLMNGVRQMIVACGFLYLSQFIIKRKIVPFFIGIFLLSGFHHSALILLPTYLFAYIPSEKISIYNNRTISLSIFITCFLLGQAPSFHSVLKYIEPLLNTTGYDNYLDFYSQILSGYNKESLSFGPIMISSFLLSLVVIWYGPTLGEAFGEKISGFNLWYLFSYIYSCGYFLVCNVSHMMIRPFKYFEFYLVVLLTILLHYFYERKSQYRLHLFGLIFLIWICSVIGVYKDIDRPVEFTIYKTYVGRI